MKTEYPDLDAAERNWLQLDENGHFHSGNGANAFRLMDSHDFKVTPAVYAIWELTGDSRIFDDSPVAILRANQSTLECALTYMKEGRVLVYNKAAIES